MLVLYTQPGCGCGSKIMSNRANMLLRSRVCDYHSTLSHSIDIILLALHMQVYNYVLLKYNEIIHCNQQALCEIKAVD